MRGLPLPAALLLCAVIATFWLLSPLFRAIEALQVALQRRRGSPWMRLPTS